MAYTVNFLLHTKSGWFRVGSEAQGCYQGPGTFYLPAMPFFGY